MVAVADLGRERLGGLDGAVDEQVGEARVELLDLGGGRGGRQPDHQAVAAPADGVVAAPEGLDLGDGGGHVVGDAVQGVVVGRDEPHAGELRVDVVVPGSPVGAARGVEQHHRGGDGLAGLEQGQQLEGLVLGAEATGQAHEGRRLLDQHQLAGEEVLHGHVLVVAEDLARLLLEGQPDADADRPLGPCTLGAGQHDPRPGAGDDHPAGARQLGGQVPGLLVEGVVATRCEPTRRS